MRGNYPYKATLAITFSGLKRMRLRNGLRIDYGISNNHQIP